MQTVSLPHEVHSSTPLVMLHGLFGSGTNFRGVAKQLATRRMGRMVYCLDLRNHGEAPWNECHTYPSLAADVIAWMDGAGLAKVDLLGHSMGGKVAMSVALTAPERIGKLVVVDIAPVTYEHSMAEYAEAMMGVDLDAMRTRRDVDRILAATIAQPAIRAFLLQNLKRSEAGFRWRVNLGALLEHMGDIGSFPAFPGRVFPEPTLFLHGDRSDYVLPEYGRAIHRFFPEAQIHKVEDSGHWVHAEQPEAFLRAVQRFIRPLA